jgi:N,N-dimethylformamidase
MKRILGYTDTWSVFPGQSLGFKVGTETDMAYRADLVRVICGNDNPAHGVFREEEIEWRGAGTRSGRHQPIHAGSYAVAPMNGALSLGKCFTLYAWVFPTTPDKGEQALLAQWDGNGGTGFALIVDDTGAAALRIGSEKNGIVTATSGAPLAERRWSLVTASFDSATGVARVGQFPRATTFDARPPARGEVAEAAFSPARGDITMAALPAARGYRRPVMAGHFNGKLDTVGILNEVRSDAEVFDIANSGAHRARHPGTIAAWDFSAGMGTDRITDLGPNALHGRLVNVPSRACKGFNWSGEEQNWRHAPQEYGAIHFHDDDLYDAGWETDFDLTVPETLRSGMYAMRLRADGDETYIPFFVRAPKGRETAKLAFLVSTVTYMAYANYHWHYHEPYAEVAEAMWTTLEKTDVFLQEHPEFGLSTYDTHSDGSGVRYSSRLRPILNMAPKTPLWSFNADTHITGWLESRGIEYDIVTDEDLHGEGAAALEPYRAVISGTHPEYYTSPMMAGLRDYIAGSGRLFYPGGNGFIWRCALSDNQPGILELRRSEDGIRYRDEEPGEYYLEFTGEYGGLWRRLGLPPQALVGVGTIAAGFDRSGHFARTPESLDPRVSFIFDGIGEDEIIGDFGLIGGGASGSEIDAADAALGTPAHALVVARSAGHSENTLIVPDEIGFNHTVMDGAQSPRVRADMTFFETPGGGAVFSTGSIAWAGSLSHDGYDNNVARLSENVVRRFLSDAPFEMPDRTGVTERGTVKRPG